MCVREELLELLQLVVLTVTLPYTTLPYTILDLDLDLVLRSNSIFDRYAAQAWIYGSVDQRDSLDHWVSGCGRFRRTKRLGRVPTLER